MGACKRPLFLFLHEVLHRNQSPVIAKTIMLLFKKEERSCCLVGEIWTFVFMLVASFIVRIRIDIIRALGFHIQFQKAIVPVIG